MTDGKPAPAAPSSGPIAQEIAKWLRDIRKGWTQSLDDSPPPPSPNALSRPLRWVYGASGSFTWLFGLALVVMARDPRFVNPIFTYEPVTLILTGLIFSAWFGWLIAFVNRKCGPIRLFLDGLLLPTATATIIGLSVGRIQPAGEGESPQDTRSQGSEESSQSQPIPLTRPPGLNQSPQDTDGTEESEEGGNELPN